MKCRPLHRESHETVWVSDPWPKLLTPQSPVVRKTCRTQCPCVQIVVHPAIRWVPHKSPCTPPSRRVLPGDGRGPGPQDLLVSDRRLPPVGRASCAGRPASAFDTPAPTARVRKAAGASCLHLAAAPRQPSSHQIKAFPQWNLEGHW